MERTALCALKAATCAFLKFIFTEHTIKEILGAMEMRRTRALLLRSEIFQRDIRGLVMEI